MATLTLVRNVFRRLDFSYSGLGGLNITSAQFVVKKSLSDPDDRALLNQAVNTSLTALGQVTQANTNGVGKVTIYILETSFIAFAVNQPYAYRLKLTLDNGSTVTHSSLDGTFTVVDTSTEDDIDTSNDDKLVLVDTPFEMATAVTPSQNTVYRTMGFWEAGDKGSADYFWDADSVVSADGVSVIAIDGVPTGRFVLSPRDGKANPYQFGATGDGQMRYLTTAYKGITRFPTLADAQVQYPATKGTWFELLSTSDTLDAVAIQACIAFCIANGYEMEVKQGFYQYNGRGMWAGDYEHGEYGNPGSVNWWMKYGFKMKGLNSRPRRQADGHLAAGFYFAGDFANRHTLRVNASSAPTSGGITLKCRWGNEQTTASILFSDNAAAIKTKLEALSDIGSGKVTVTCPAGGTGATLASGYTFVIVFARNLPTGTKSFHGDMIVAANTLNNSGQAVAYFDGGLLNLRGQAQGQWCFENFGLRSEDSYLGGTAYSVSAGINLAHSTMNGHSFKNIEIMNPKVGITMLENDGGNGESMLFERVKASTGKYLYFNAGQAYNHKHIGWEWGHDGIMEAGDNSEQVFVEYGGGTILGYTNDFYAGEGRFSDSASYMMTLFKMNGRGGSVNGVTNLFTCRFEHITTLFNSEPNRSWNHDGKFNILDCEFTCRGSTAHPVINEMTPTGGLPSPYTVTVRGCKFTPYDHSQDFVVNLQPDSKMHIDFIECEIVEWRSRQIKAPYCAFHLCRWGDAGLDASNGFIRPLNQVHESFTDIRGSYTGDAKNPFMRAGKPLNVLTNPNFSGQTPGATTVVAGWDIENSGGIGGQSFVDCGSNIAGKTWTQAGYGKNSFAFKLALNHSLIQTITSYDLGSPVYAMYRAKVSVQAGTYDFMLVNSATGQIYDLVRFSTATSIGPTMVELGIGNPQSVSAGQKIKLMIKAIEANSVCQIHWQQMFDYRSIGVYTVPSESQNSAYHWDSVVQNARILDRLVIPSRTYAQGLGAGIPLDDAQIGEMYYDTDVDRMLVKGNTAWKGINDSVLTITGLKTNTDYTFTEKELLAEVIECKWSGWSSGHNGIVAALKRKWWIYNATGQTITVKTASGTGIAIATGATALVYCDGTNVLRLSADATATA